MADVFFFMLMGTLVLYRDTLDICRRHYGHVWMPQRVRTICQSWGLLCVGHDMLQLWFCTVNMIHQTWWSLSISRQFFFQWNLWTLKKSYPTKHCLPWIEHRLQSLHLFLNYCTSKLISQSWTRTNLPGGPNGKPKILSLSPNEYTSEASQTGNLVYITSRCMGIGRNWYVSRKMGAFQKRSMSCWTATIVGWRQTPFLVCEFVCWNMLWDLWAKYHHFLCMDLFTLTFGHHFLLLQIGFGSCSLSLMNLDVPPPKALALEKESRCFTLFQLLLSCGKYLSSFGVSLPRFVWSIQSDATWRGGLSWI